MITVRLRCPTVIRAAMAAPTRTPASFRLWKKGGLPCLADSYRALNYSTVIFRQQQLGQCYKDQTVEANAFLQRVAALPHGPGVDLSPVLAPSLQDEAELRKLFATDRKNERLSNPYVGLVDVFAAPSAIRTTRARVVTNEEDKIAKYICPLEDSKRRVEGTPSMVPDLETFRKSWNIFTEGALSQLTDWSNVIAAGGSVLGCLQPLSESAAETRRTMRKYFHSGAYPASDVDLFLWGLTPEEAEEKIKRIYEAVRDSVPWDATCVRTRHAISIYSQYPYRCVQIVLRLYHSPAEVLAGFDVDAPCVMYDGNRVMANPRAIVAFMRQCNTVDITRRSPSYEIRLMKYAGRGFEIFVPDLRRGDIDPTIFERSLHSVDGLARLLVLEKLSTPQARVAYLASRRGLRSRPTTNSRRSMRRKKQYKNDLKAALEVAGLESSNYDSSTVLHIPYGPGWHAKRIDTLIYRTDLAMNSPFNSLNEGRRLHRHAAFFGTMEECIEDCCEHCPVPANEEEKKLFETESESYITGRISFMKEDPGRQSMTGSFKPIDSGEWSTQAYIDDMEKFLTAIAAHDLPSVQKLVIEGVIDVNRRDHVGRTPLHVAILAKAVNIATYLIDSGARMTSRLVDGRTALHLAAQNDLLPIIQKLMERSKINDKEAKQKEKEKEEALKSVTKSSDDKDEDDDMEDDEEKNSSEDDWSSGDEDGKPKAKKQKKNPEEDTEQPAGDAADIPEDNLDQPDVFDINVKDWDMSFTPLNYAIIAGSLPVVNFLLDQGADPTLTTPQDPQNKHNNSMFYPLTLALLTEDEAIAAKIVEKLLRSGATTTSANIQMYTIFHQFVLSGKTRLVQTVLQADPKVKTVINFPGTNGNSTFITPVVSAMAHSDYDILALLLAYGANLVNKEEDWVQIMRLIEQQKSWSGHLPYNKEDRTRHALVHGLEVSAFQHDELAYFMLDTGIDPSFPISNHNRYSRDVRSMLTLPEAVETLYHRIEEWLKNDRQSKIENEVNNEKAASFSWVKAIVDMNKKVEGISNGRSEEQEREHSERNARIRNVRLAQSAYCTRILEALKKAGAKTWAELYPDKETFTKDTRTRHTPNTNANTKWSYRRLQHPVWANQNEIGDRLNDQYDALYEAVWTGDTRKIRSLTLPSSSSSSKTSEQPELIQISSVGMGMSPLNLAILTRRWDIVRLVFSIAAAQYQKPTQTEDKGFMPQEIKLSESDSEDESEEEDEDDEMEVDREEPVNVDVASLAKLPSAVHCNAPPDMMLTNYNATRLSRDGKKVVKYGQALHQACQDDDLEAFIHIADLYKMLPEPQEPDYALLQSIMMADSAEVLDEYIRRCGAHIKLDESQEDADAEQESTATKKSKVYLGLNVHGKKRKDLAKAADQHAPNLAEQSTPLLWEAIRIGSTKIMAYLLSDTVWTALRYYATTSSSDRALQLRRISDLKARLSGTLGLLPNANRESPMIMTCLSPDKEAVNILKALQALQPDEVKAFAHARTNIMGVTPLLIAVSSGKSAEYIDLLLGYGVSADVYDTRGWNVYHYACYRGSVEHVEHLIKKLSPVLTSKLLSSSSRNGMNTPLMLAVKQNRHAVVASLLKHGGDAVRATHLDRDATGSLPLHVAVRDGRYKVVDLLVKNGPVEALLSENGTGETPLETAAQHLLILKAQKRFIGRNASPQVAPDHWNSQIPNRNSQVAFDRELLGVKIQELKSVMTMLENEGKFWGDNQTLKTALDSFVGRLEAKYADEDDLGFKPVTLDMENTDQDKRFRAEKCPPYKQPPEEEDKSNNGRESRHETFRIISSALLESGMSNRRILVRLADVQRSVRHSLDAARPSKKNAYHGGDPEVMAEEDSEEKEDPVKQAYLWRWSALAFNGHYDAKE